MQTDMVLSEIRDGYRLITLNRPDRLNSLGGGMHTLLLEALKAAGADTRCRAVLLTGAGRGFCAGQDLADVAVTPGKAPDLGNTIETLFNPVVRTLRDLPMPVICAVNGVAAGAGANIAFACDIVLAARSAKFIQSFAKIGLIPDAGGSWVLPRLAGRARARGMAMLAEPVTAEQAESWGMIWKVLDDAALMNEAHRLAAHLATQPTEGLALIKQALDAAETNDLDRQLDLERDLQDRAGRTRDYGEGVAAFLDKRAPKFTGRA